jgi:hypothetical protein
VAKWEQMLLAADISLGEEEDDDVLKQDLNQILE